MSKFLEKVYKKVLELDMFSKPIPLTFKGKRSYQTLLGAILSI